MRWFIIILLFSVIAVAQDTTDLNTVDVNTTDIDIENQSTSDIDTFGVSTTAVDNPAGVPVKSLQSAEGVHKFVETQIPGNVSTGAEDRADLISRLVEHDFWSKRLQQEPVIESKPLPDNSYYKAVSDMRPPVTQEQYENQLAELEYFQSQGYNSAMIVWRGETDFELLHKTIRNLPTDWNYIFAPAPGRNFYRNPDEYRKVFQEIIPYCDFTIPGWYHFSNNAHWGNQGTRPQDVAALVELMREVDSDFPVVGEIWFGGADDITRFEPGYTSGILLVNAMFFKYREFKPKIDVFAEAIDRRPLFAMVHGTDPADDRTNDPEVLFPLGDKIQTMLQESDQYRGGIYLSTGGYGGNDLRKTDYHNTFGDN